MEQPASPKDYMPETVSPWHTKECASFKKECGWEETTFQQGAIHVWWKSSLRDQKEQEVQRRKGKGDIKTSKDLDVHGHRSADAASDAAAAQTTSFELG